MVTARGLRELTKAEIERITLMALQAYGGPQWRALERIEKELARIVSDAIVDARECAQEASERPRIRT
jgi:hypothetical protein